MQLDVVVPNYNHSASVTRCLDALLTQKLSGKDTFTITVVDDGSTDSSASFIQARYGERVKLIGLEMNQGRSTARNTGASQSDADFVIFIDSDCIPTDDSFIQAYIDEASKGADLVFGQVSTRSENFWDLLQKSAFRNRQNEFESGRHWAYTTQNVCIKRVLFLKSGGFDLAFDRYGFEDRDLFIRLIKMGAKPLYCHNANVIHDDKISLASVSRKMLDSGKYAARSFQSKHPAEYARTVYSKIDYGLNRKLILIDWILWPIARLAAQSRSDWLECRLIPFQLKSLVARAIYGMHYLHGTVLTAKAEAQARSG